jgi:hypothetical protein
MVGDEPAAVKAGCEAAATAASPTGNHAMAK